MPRSPRSGFSLLELAITMGIIAIVAAVAVPAYARHRANLQLKASVDQVAAALREAQSTARTLSDGAVVDQAAITNLPTSTNRFTVYAVRAGSPTAVKNGDASYCSAAVAVATSATNDNHSAGGSVEDLPADGGAAATPSGRVGAMVDVNGNRVFFGQDGTVADGRSHDLTFSNGDRAYDVKVSAQGTVTVSEIPLPAAP